MVSERPKRLSSTKPFSDNDLHPDLAESWSDSEQDDDYTPDQDNSSDIDDEDDNDNDGGADLSNHEQPIRSPSASSERGTKRAATERTEVEGQETKRVKEDNKDDPQAELDRKARIDAIWAEMNQKDDRNGKRVNDKQPLDDISSSENQTTSELSSQQQAKRKISTDSGVGSSKTSSTVTTHINDNPTTATSATSATAHETPRKKPGIIRPKSTLSALASHYNVKVPKMNTLEKSRLDWKGYVKQEGIQDELKYQNEDSYTDKVAFLQRVDDRRLSHIRAGRKASRKP